MNQPCTKTRITNIFESANALKALYKQTQEGRVEAPGILPYEAVMNLLDVIDWDVSTLCYALGISGYDLIEKQFTEEQSTKIMAIANLYGHGYTLYNTARGFNYWMKYRALNRGSVPPLSLLNQEAGVKEVDDMLSRAEYGSF